MIAIRKMRPWTVLTQAPVRPDATSPASIMPMMKQPNTVPRIVAWPPKIDVPPMSTEAMAVNRYPWPWLPKKFLFSSVSMMAAQAARKPINVKILIFSRSTSMPTTRETSLESPIKSVCSPNRWRVRISQRKPTMSAVQTACIESCWSQSIVVTEANGRPTIHCQTELSSAPRSA